MLLSIAFGQHALAAFTEPTNQPPDDNSFEFLRIDDTNQAKSGALRLGTDDISTPYSYQLEVRGEGALLSKAVVDQNLKSGLSGDTLFVDAVNNKVCIGSGSCLNVGAKLEVSNGGAQFNGGQERGLTAVSSNNQAIYGEGGNYGLYGVAGGSGGLTTAGIKGVALDTAVRGYGAPTKNQVYGYSVSGYGIYGYNTNAAGLWSGYFDGRLESTSDVSGAKFTPTRLQPSFIPYTSGQLVAEYRQDQGYDYAVNFQPQAFDGTNMWGVSGSTLYKVRASDGFKIFSLNLGGIATGVMFDGQYLWATVAYSDSTPDRVAKIDPYAGSEVSCPLTFAADYNPRSIVFDGLFYWVANGNGQIVKISSACVSYGEMDVQHALTKMIFDGTYLWAIASDDDEIIKINPVDVPANNYSANVVIAHSDFQNPQDILFDNYYYWVANHDGDTVTKFYFDATGQPVAFGTYAVTDGPQYLVFDGTYVWVAGTNVDGSNQTAMTRLLTADARQTNICNTGSGQCDLSKRTCTADSDCLSDHRVDFLQSTVPAGLGFDGNNIWFGAGSTSVRKYFSGSGWSMTDLSGTLTLQHNNSLWQQTGSMNVSQSGRIGDTLTASGDLAATADVWGQATAGDTIGDGVNPLGQGTFTCPTGHFIKNIVTDGAGVVTQIECRPL